MHRVRFAVIGDVHAEFVFLDRVMAHLASDPEPIDGILLVGDVGRNFPRLRQFQKTPEADMFYRESVAGVLDRVRRLGRPIAWVPGNHDLPTFSDPDNIDHTSATIAGVRISGIGGAGPHRFGFPYEWSEDEIRHRPIPPCEILLCHCPPKDTPLDLTIKHQHVGSAAIRELAERHVGVLVCGHIHEAPGVCRLGRCVCLNAGGLGKPFGRPQLGFVSHDFDGTWHAQHLDLSPAMDSAAPTYGAWAADNKPATPSP